jgi:hypothetical protein
MLVIMETDHCTPVYPKRGSLAEIAFISRDVPSDEVLRGIDIAFVDIDLPDGLEIIKELRAYAHENGGIERVFGFFSRPITEIYQINRIADAVEYAGAEFILQIVGD